MLLKAAACSVEHTQVLRGRLCPSLQTTTFCRLWLSMPEWKLETTSTPANITSHFAAEWDSICCLEPSDATDAPTVAIKVLGVVQKCWPALIVRATTRGLGIASRGADRSFVLWQSPPPLLFSPRVKTGNPQKQPCTCAGVSAATQHATATWLLPAVSISHLLMRIIDIWRVRASQGATCWGSMAPKYWLLRWQVPLGSVLGELCVVVRRNETLLGLSVFVLQPFRCSCHLCCYGWWSLR